MEARGFWSTPDLEEHITYKELKAVRCAIKSFLPELKGKRLLLHEDNQSVIGVPVLSAVNRLLQDHALPWWN